MSWAIGFDSKWQRDIGYGVPAYCDHPECEAEIDRGLSYVCGSEPYGGEHGCGLYFCEKHLDMVGEDEHPNMINDEVASLCERCLDVGQQPFEKSGEHPDWMRFKLKDPSWAEWRQSNESLAVSYILALAKIDNEPIQVGELENSLNDVMVIKNHHGKRQEDPMKPGYFLPKMKPYVRMMPRIGRNEPCPCGSGKKYKKCCI